jgi:apolipoprotein N-acyltransferase
VLEPDGLRKYNSALLLDARGQVVDRYDKVYRVPFGEYVPWEKTLPFMRWLTPYEGDYGINPGTRQVVFTLPSTHRFAVLICYEDTVPHFAPEFLRHPEGGQAPDFVINISNDGWFKGSSEHEQHLVAARFRAIECRRAMARSVNMGITCIIDGDGRLVAMPGATWAESKNRTAVVVGPVPIDRRESFYVRWGDWLPGACWGVCGVGLAISLLRRQPRIAN